MHARILTFSVQQHNISGTPLHWHGGRRCARDDWLPPAVAADSKVVEERRRALRFLIHFIEDMHQPCHVGDNTDRGGNDTQVQFFDRGTNMHSLWDGGMLARMRNEEVYWLKELTVLPSSQMPEDAAAGTVEDYWATESLLAAREAFVDPATGQRIKSGASWDLTITTRTFRW